MIGGDDVIHENSIRAQNGGDWGIIFGDAALAATTLAGPRGSPQHLKDGVKAEGEFLDALGLEKNTLELRPTAADMDSAAFKVIVGRPKYTSGGQPIGTAFDSVQGGLFEIKTRNQRAYLVISTSVAGLLFLEDGNPIYYSDQSPSEHNIRPMASSVGRGHRTTSLSHRMDLRYTRYTRHQVPRATRPDAEAPGKFYLIKNVSSLRATYQIRLLTFKAVQTGGKLVVAVPRRCKLERSLRDLIDLVKPTIEIQRIK